MGTDDGVGGKFFLWTPSSVWVSILGMAEIVEESGRKCRGELTGQLGLFKESLSLSSSRSS